MTMGAGSIRRPFFACDVVKKSLSATGLHPFRSRTVGSDYAQKAEEAKEYCPV